MEQTNKRQVARKLLISDIHAATYIKRPGWEPSGILTRYGEISRVYLIGVIVSLSGTKEGELKEGYSFLLDDGSGSIEIRYFETPDYVKNLSLSDMVAVVGRPREWGSNKYIAPEIVKKIENKRWYNVHQLEIRLLKKTNSIKLPAMPESEDINETGPYQKILNIIAILDKGDGASVEELIKNIKIENCDTIINSLIEEGEIFEISPGKVKLLE